VIHGCCAGGNTSSHLKPDRRVSSDGTRGGKLNFLIVDDHPGTRTMLRSVLEDLMRSLPGPVACQIRECHSGEEAVGLCGTYVPDFITVDLRMSGMSGLLCVRHLRALHPATQIAVVTQFDNDALRVHARQAGADIYIPKDNLEPLRRYVQLMITTLQS
jgi:DNA-binding NarL/FixJ family response regulator